MLYRLLLFVVLPILVEAQTPVDIQQDKLVENYKGEKGVKWTVGLSWEEVLEKAKAEKKLVFVDCYATWCGPCKVMDQNVYPDEKVGSAVNDKFVSIKIQMDKTTNDNENVRAWYKDAESLQNRYNIDAYPTLLFFSSDGSLLHRVTQGVNVDGFIEVISTALDPKKRYYSILAEYQNGKKDTGLMQNLIKAAQEANDKKMAEQIAEEYFSAIKPANLYDKQIRNLVRVFSKGPNANKLALGYIDQLKEREIYTKDNIEVIRQFTKRSTQKGFKIFYNNPHRVNSIIEGVVLPKDAVNTMTQGDYAESVVRSIIYLEEFYDPILKPSLEDSNFKIEPQWPELSKSIFKKYPTTDVDRIVTDAQVTWYEWKKDWPLFSKVKIMQLDMTYFKKSLKGKMFDINSRCWSLFKRATDTSILNKAIYWMEEAFRQNERDLKWSTALDTYANLLYKVGRTKEAIEWQTKAVEYGKDDPEIITAFEKMKKGLPTWPQN